jgi:two-component system phosphate regulon sensor histidine kinase PhoR
MIRSRLFWSIYACFLAAIVVTAIVAISVSSGASRPWLAVLAGIAAGAAVALGLGVRLASRVTRPIATMHAIVASMAQERAGRPRATATDEIGALADALDTLRAEQRERMQTMLDERNKVLGILSSMVEGVVAVDQEERIVHLNGVAARVLGVSPGEGIGRRLWEVTRLHEVNDALRAVMEGEPEVRREARLVQGPRDQVIEIHASPLRDADGEPSGAVVVLHDVTELRRLEQVRSEFVANASHELKTPLAAIRGLVETLLDDDAMDPERARRFLDRIRVQTHRLGALVADLLALSRVESQDAPLERVRVDLRDVIAESARTFASAADAKRIVVTAAAPAAPVHALGDPEALRQVVDNLLDNAIKYTPEGGRIDLRVRDAGGSSILEVQDTGIGIEPRDQERIFERFYRVDKGRSREMGGTGLGLSIVKHIVLAHGGRIALESQAGAGSLFRVALPRAG